jgi:hypothetical protein
MRWLLDTVHKEFHDLSDIQTGFNEAFRFFKHYFPQRELPRVYTMVTDFSYFPFIFLDRDGKDAIGVSLEMFLGANFPYRDYVGNAPAFSNYLVRTFNKDHLVKKSLEVLVDDMLVRAEYARLLDEMIHNGKRWYILSRLMPFAHDTIITEYRPDQLEWCEKNQLNLWAYLLSNDLLYSTDRLNYQKLIAPSPSGASDMPQEAPGQTANWMGFQIIKAFMKRSPGTSLQELIELSDAQMILKKSKYKPSG